MVQLTNGKMIRILILCCTELGDQYLGNGLLREDETDARLYRFFYFLFLFFYFMVAVTRSPSGSGLLATLSYLGQLLDSHLIQICQ